MHFKTTWKLTLLLFVLAALFAKLGTWQMTRMAEKENLFVQFDQAPQLALAQALESGQRFARVQATGRYDPQRHLLLDNRMHQGRPGVHVLTPFETDTGTVILVNRGWLPIPPDRSRLPTVQTDATTRTITGRLNLLASAGPRLGEADVLRTDHWPQLVTYLDQAPVSEALGTEIEEWIVQLDAEQEGGFQGRNWQPAVMEPATHGGYALQWFSLAAASIVIWLVLGFRRSATLERQD